MRKPTAAQRQAHAPAAKDKRKSPQERREQLRALLRRRVTEWRAEEARKRAFRIPAIPIDLDARLTTETRRQADLAFERAKQVSVWKRYKEAEKRSFAHALFHAGKQALYHGWAVKYRRSLKGSSKAELQVIDALVEAGLFAEHRSLPGWSPHMSRLIPTPALADLSTLDPWSIGPSPVSQYVYSFDRASGRELPCDLTHPVAADVQAKLELVNAVNSRHMITYCKWDEWEDCLEQQCRRLRPVHFARFLDGFDLHGRIYTGRYGHQALRKKERCSIRFDGEPSVELDYAGLHPRLLYHREGIDYRDDPYALWGGKTTPAMRHMAKQLINALINARTAEAAVDACNRKMSTYAAGTDARGRRVRKRGEALRKAVRLQEAARESGLRFKGMVPLVLQVHQGIACHFGADAGVALMRTDAAIALAVLWHFARLDIPCLGVHDSFLVPRKYCLQLRRVMLTCYQRETGFYPLLG